MSVFASFSNGEVDLVEEARRRDTDANRELEMLLQFRKCPKCGSVDRYTQRRDRERNPYPA